MTDTPYCGRYGNKVIDLNGMIKSDLHICLSRIIQLNSLIPAELFNYSG